MRNVFAAVVIALFFSFSASAADMAMQDPAARTAVEIHSQGVVKSWDERKVSIAHQAIPALSWPPMTMSFLLPSSPSFAVLPVGTEVDFSFLPIDGGYQLIAIAAARP
ncbi:Cation efflux system protein CusF precursor [Serratia liquefaciens]|jgi:Cu(I)/Ag(I) efflux system protein CusF|uniref:Copper-binding protein n=1 Tax=Serratia liquefaciens TaxID=614 RepID=A0A379YL36_SERLI|nr:MULTISPECIES: copper-binding protein [Serratia]AGQ32149.1 copper-binding protein [Serratia liquefaciens ATCC 27592]AMH01233.1 copper-binding protein [Serratia liquefaciens]AYO39136.1 copper-binding protein [Serratia sp. P2ACOL2]MBF8106064.1 copper-binding protein [Serratia liquefaciens]MBH2811487.1 copper-binding protein [Serratia liquefaciens]